MTHFNFTVDTVDFGNGPLLAIFPDNSFPAIISFNADGSPDFSWYSSGFPPYDFLGVDADATDAFNNWGIANNIAPDFFDGI